MYDAIQNYSFENIDKFSTSSIVTRLTADVTNVQNAIMMMIRVAVCAAFTVSAKLSLIYLAAIPLLGIGLWIIVHLSHPLFERVFHIYDATEGSVEVEGVNIQKYDLDTLQDQVAMVLQKK